MRYLHLPLLLLLSILMLPPPAGGAASSTNMDSGLAHERAPGATPQAIKELLVNGGFEQGGEGWSQEGFTFSSARVRTGAGAAASTPGVPSVLRQQVVFPAAPSAVTLRYALDNPTFDLYDSLEICLRPTGASAATWCVSEGAADTGLRVRERRLEGGQVLSLAGKSVELSFRASDDGRQPSVQYFLDDVSLTIDDGQPLPPVPPPTPPGVIELVRDGTFEGDGSAWTRREAVYTRSKVRSGFGALVFTPGVRAELRQTLVFPQQVAGVSVHYGVAGVDSDLKDTLQSCLYRAGTAWELWCGVAEFATTGGAWVPRSQTVDTQAARLMAGQAVDLVFRVTQNSDNVSTRFFLDDISVAVDDGQAPPQPQPSRGEVLQLIRDGGFEGDGTAWERREAEPSVAAAFSGRQGLSFFPGSDGYVRQTVTFPPDLVSAIFSFTFSISAQDISDELEFCLYREGTALPFWCRSRGLFLLSDAPWEPIGYSLEPGILRRLAGQRVDVVFRQIQNNRQANVNAFVDNVSLVVERNAGGPSTVFLPLLRR